LSNSICFETDFSFLSQDIENLPKTRRTVSYREACRQSALRPDRAAEQGAFGHPAFSRYHNKILPFFAALERNPLFLIFWAVLYDC
jgi:hypothetical protein